MASKFRRVLIYVTAAIFAVALIRHFYDLGAPYFAIPETVQDHVSIARPVSRDAIVMTQRAALLIPRGATVTVLGDPTLNYLASGTMPHHAIVSDDAQYVITLRGSLDDPAYALQDELPEGKIYKRR
jgi:hypothetical protein